MVKEKGLTGIHEFARGFVGSKPAPKYDHTKQGKPRMRFELACGQPDESHGKLATWRHCIAYSDIADSLREMKVGNLVHCNGWVQTEYVLDEYFKPQLDLNGHPQKIEYLILYKAEIKDYVKRSELQPALLPA